MSQPKRPNFFIVGAPKCGTTSLYQYLQAHPQVFMPRIKEPHYFAGDFPDYRRIRDSQEYASLFRPATSRHRAIGEASVFYLYSRRAASAIHAFAPDAKILVMIRNPVDLAPSLHQQLLYSGREELTRFEEAWRAQSARAKGERLPRRCLAPEHLQYRDVVSLGAQLERLLSVFPRNQVQIGFLNDLQRDPGRLYRETLSFLGLSDDGRERFPRINERKMQRSRLVGRLISDPPFPLAPLKRAAKRIFRLERSPIGRLLYGMNTVPAPRPALDGALRAEIVRTLATDVDKLQRITGRDVSQWLADEHATTEPAVGLTTS